MRGGALISGISDAPEKSLRPSTKEDKEDTLKQEVVLIRKQYIDLGLSSPQNYEK